VTEDPNAWREKRKDMAEEWSFEKLFRRPVRQVWTAKNKRKRWVLLAPVIGLLLGLVAAYFILR
jgi:hypothetical protein